MPPATTYPAMRPSSLPVARPWTPPDMDSDGESKSSWMSDGLKGRSMNIADSGYFEGSFHDISKTETDDHAWDSSASQSSRLSATPSISHRRRLLSSYRDETKGLGITDPEARPLTPIKSASYSDAPAYPYTPESARSTLQRSRTFNVPSSPLPAMPWDSSPPSTALDHKPPSPVQDALLSCLRNLEHHIRAQQPNDDQMEYLISQFESMTSYLSAPDSQTKGLDEHLFSEPEQAHNVGGVPVIPKEEVEAYVTEVGKYVAGIEKRTRDLKLRFDEVKELNHINMSVIADLRRQLRDQDTVSSTTTTNETKPQAEESEAAGVRVMDQPRGFWSAMAEALDQMGELLHGW
jgi:hypothetical protein